MDASRLIAYSCLGQRAIAAFRSKCRWISAGAWAALAHVTAVEKFWFARATGGPAGSHMEPVWPEWNIDAGQSEMDSAFSDGNRSIIADRSRSSCGKPVFSRQSRRTSSPRCGI